MKLRHIITLALALVFGLALPDGLVEAEAAKVKHPVRSESRELVLVAGSFAPDSANPPTSTTLRGNGWTAARTSTGVWTITFAESYPELVAGLATIQRSSDADTVAELGVYTAASRTITVKSLAAATATDIAANANNRVNFLFVFRASALTR